MALEELRDNFADIDKDTRSYLENTGEYYKLQVFKIVMRSITSFAKMMLVGSVALLSLFMLSFAAAYGIGLWLENTFLGFMFVGLFYIIIGIICYLYRHRLDGSLLKKFSEYYFD
ncbi:phage holin family protein [Arenibacter sp. F20364]|uniref:phage holin family protein n=1 Tax=Arenibacter sp. F20364 TaxID=2926415 RepID=UPI001FF25EE8|nr:phage holin family protein [Arenibacter sp. F20364]MCK0191685.1 phage holin family protein [Arenibacter sp. F20364]